MTPPEKRQDTDQPRKEGPPAQTDTGSSHPSGDSDPGQDPSDLETHQSSPRRSRRADTPLGQESLTDVIKLDTDETDTTEKLANDEWVKVAFQGKATRQAYSTQGAAFLGEPSVTVTRKPGNRGVEVLDTAGEVVLKFRVEVTKPLASIPISHVSTAPSNRVLAAKDLGVADRTIRSGSRESD